MHKIKNNKLCYLLQTICNTLHNSLQMRIKRYAKWIHGDKNRKEMAKLNTRT